MHNLSLPSPCTQQVKMAPTGRAKKENNVQKYKQGEGVGEEDVLDKDMNGSDKDNDEMSAWLNYHGVSDHLLC